MIAFGPLGQHLLDRHRRGHDLAVDVALAHPAGDQLGVLRAEVDDEDGVDERLHAPGHGIGWRADADRRRPPLGSSSTESRPAPTRALASAGVIWPVETPRSVMTTTSGSAVEAIRASATPDVGREHAAVERQHRQAPYDEERQQEQRHLVQAWPAWPSASRSKRMPLSTKKTGTKTPKPTASSLPSTSWSRPASVAAVDQQPHDHAGRERAEQDVEPERRRDPHQRGHDDQATRTGSWPGGVQGVRHQVAQPAHGSGRRAATAAPTGEERERRQQDLAVAGVLAGRAAGRWRRSGRTPPPRRPPAGADRAARRQRRRRGRWAAACRAPWSSAPGRRPGP